MTKNNLASTPGRKTLNKRSIAVPMSKHVSKFILFQLFMASFVLGPLIIQVHHEQAILLFPFIAFSAPGIVAVFFSNQQAPYYLTTLKITLGYTLSFMPSFVLCMMLALAPPAVVNIAWILLIVHTFFFATISSRKDFLTANAISSLFVLAIAYCLTFLGVTKYSNVNLLMPLYAYIITVGVGLFFFSGQQPCPHLASNNFMCSLAKEIEDDVIDIVGNIKGNISLLEMYAGSDVISKDQKGEKMNICLDKVDYKEIGEIFTNIKKISQDGLKIIKLRLDPWKNKAIDVSKFDNYSMAKTIDSAIKAYVEVNTFSFNLPKLVLNSDYKYYGSDKHIKDAIMRMLAYSYDYKKHDGEKTIILKNDAFYYRYESKQLTAEELGTIFQYPVNPTGQHFRVHRGGGIHAMYYVNEIIKEHKGTISCKQKREGDKNYITFALKLPISS